MDHSFKVGASFGMISGIITTLGLMTGLQAGTHSEAVVLGGIIVIAVADAFSDALGIHISEEAENVHSPQEIWMSTIATFVAKFLFSSIFVIPILIFSLKAAILVSVAFGMGMIAVISYILAVEQKIKPWKVILEHFVVAAVVVVLTNHIGTWVSRHFH